MKGVVFLIVMYDIKETKTRTALSKLLEYYGLQRAQYSVFMGELDRPGFNELRDRLKNYGLEQGDKVRIVELCESCRRKMIVIGEDVPEKQQHIILG